MTETTTHQDAAPRLRDHPFDRNIDASQTLDLGAALDHLLAEDHPAIHGHRQVTLFHQAPVTLVLFAFDAGGELPDHVAQGMVTIQALDGALTVHAVGADYMLKAGQILVLNPAVPHTVRAEHASSMLLTVHQVEPAGAE